MAQLSKREKELLRIRKNMNINRNNNIVQVRAKKAPKWLYPTAIERDFVKILQTYTAGQEAIIQKALQPELTKIYKTYDIEKPDIKKIVKKDSIKNDGYIEDFEKMMSALKISIGDYRKRSNINTYALNIGQKTSKWNDEQWQKTTLAVMGVTYPTNQESIINDIEQYSYQTADLIESLGTKRLESIRKGAFDAFKNGWRHEDLQAKILNDYKTTQSRAKLIARDQVAKLNGAMMKSRQESAGIRGYVWRTSGDERVRKTHAALNGKYCFWDKQNSVWSFTRDTIIKKTSIGGVALHPGEDYQCRCWAEAIFNKSLTGEEVTFTKAPFHIPVGAAVHGITEKAKAIALATASKEVTTLVSTGLAYGAYGILKKLQAGELVIPKVKLPTIKRKRKRKPKPKRYEPKPGETTEVVKEPLIKVPQIKFPKIPEIKLPKRKVQPTKIEPGTKPSELPEVIIPPVYKPGYVPIGKISPETTRLTKLTKPDIEAEKSKTLRQLRYGFKIPGIDKMTKKEMLDLMHKNGVNLDQAFYDHDVDYDFMKLLTDRVVLYNKKFKLNLKSIEVFGGSGGLEKDHFTLSALLNSTSKGKTINFDMFMGGGFLKNTFKTIEKEYAHLMYCGEHALVSHDRILKGILDHEIIHGHIRKDANLYSKLTRYFNSKSYTEIRKGLCEYGTSKVDEMAAEGWKEYLNSSNPRPMAKQIGRMIMTSLNKHRFTHL